MIDDSVFPILETTPGLLRLLFDSLPPARVEDPVDDGWSPRHALAHILDTEDVIAGRIRRIVEEERPFIRSIDPAARLREGGCLERGVESLLSSSSNAGCSIQRTPRRMTADAGESMF